MMRSFYTYEVEDPDLEFANKRKYEAYRRRVRLIRIAQYRSVMRKAAKGRVRQHARYCVTRRYEKLTYLQPITSTYWYRYRNGKVRYSDLERAGKTTPDHIRAWHSRITKGYTEPFTPDPITQFPHNSYGQMEIVLEDPHFRLQDGTLLYLKNTTGFTMDKRVFTDKKPTPIALPVLMVDGKGGKVGDVLPILFLYGSFKDADGKRFIL